MNARTVFAPDRHRTIASDRARPIRLLIVDDSIVVRTILGRMIAAERDMEVAGLAANVDQALALLARTRVDIVLLDLRMPGQDGLTALPALIAAGHGARVLIVSSFCESGAGETVRALTLGAADTLLKPVTGSIGAPFAETLVARVRRIGYAPGDARAIAMRNAAIDDSRTLATRPRPSGPVGCLAIGASTGGLHALADFFAALPAGFDAPILVTQHLPAVFMPYFAGQLRDMSGRATHVAESDRGLVRGEILVAPGDAHLTVRTTPAGPRIALDRAPSASGCTPSVDPMFASIAESHGPSAIGVVLSGMGRDGEIGAARLADAGGEVLVQDAASAVIWGMPGAVARAGHASMIASPASLAARIAQRAGTTSWN